MIPVVKAAAKSTPNQVVLRAPRPPRGGVPRRGPVLRRAARCARRPRRPQRQLGARGAPESGTACGRSCLGCRGRASQHGAEEVLQRGGLHAAAASALKGGRLAGGAPAGPKSLCDTIVAIRWRGRRAPYARRRWRRLLHDVHRVHVVADPQVPPLSQSRLPGRVRPPGLLEVVAALRRLAGTDDLRRDPGHVVLPRGLDSAAAGGGRPWRSHPITHLLLAVTKTSPAARLAVRKGRSSAWPPSDRRCRGLREAGLRRL